MADILNNQERACLAAMAERIFPTTDTPGAIEAGVVEYIEQALAGAYAQFLTQYRAGLGELDTHCRNVHGRTFAAIPAPTRDAVLREVEAGNSPVANGQEFFEMVRQHTLEGVFGDPQYGGNKDMVGWRIVGFPGQQHGYPDPYINKVIDMPPRVEEPREWEK